MAFIGTGQKPMKLDIPDSYLFRLILLFKGLKADIENEGEQRDKFISEKINQITDELKTIRDYQRKKPIEFQKLSSDQRLHFITHTTGLEGNTMEYVEVKALLEEGKILGEPNLIEIDENRNAEKALKFVESKLEGDIIGEVEIKQIHYILLENIKKKEYESRGGWEGIAGIYRDYRVKIGANPLFKIASHDDLDKLLTYHV